jgi:hypothetical protein
MDCSSNFSRETRVLLACVSGTAHLGTPMVELLSQGVDWDLLLETAGRHGLGALLYWNISDIGGGVVPTQVLTRLEGRYKSNAIWSLALNAELVRVVRAFHQRSIAVLAYKGPILAASLYGDVAMREMCDLDLLVRTVDVRKAIDTLLELQYEPLYVLSGQQQAALLRNECERQFQSRTGVFVVDLHWNVVPPHLCLRFDFESLWRDRVCVTLGSTQIATLCAEDLVLVLSVHGGKHLWQRLCWLADFARCAATISTEKWESVLQRANNVRGRRLLALAVFLTRQLLGQHFPSVVEDELKFDGTVQRVGRAICDHWARKLDADSEDPVRWLALVQLADSKWDGARCMYRYASSSGISEWSLIRLPKPMFWLYPAVRMSRLLRKIMAG